MPEAEGPGSCLCASLPDLAVVPMGGAGFDERVLATIESLCDHGGAQWWLHLARCSGCGQHWMIAQEERIYDEHYLKRLSPTEVDAIQADRRWPEGFLTYAQVLKVGRDHGHPCIYLDPRSPALVDTIADLRRERPEIEDREIGYLIGISPRRVAVLGRARSSGGSLWRHILRRLR